MENQLQMFQSEEFGKLEVLMIEGKPYFPATVCAEILGYATPRHAITRHCKGGMKRAVLTNGGEQEVTFIPEGDLYRLIIRSKLPSAERFEKFVFDEVLPSIRKHGAYVTDETLEKILESPFFASRLFNEISEERAKNTALMEHIETLAPKARLFDLILQSTNSIPVSLIAKDYGMSAVTFNRLLCEMHIQYKMGETWLLHQPYADKGYTKSRTYYANENTAVVHTYWTMRGRLFIFDKLASCGIFPVPEKPVPLYSGE